MSYRLCITSITKPNTPLSLSLLEMCMISSCVFVLMIAVPVVATERASAKYVFTHFNTGNSAGIHSNLYIFVLGLLMSQYTLSGYDASAHMVTQKKNPLTVMETCYYGN
jgi:hypothetical protein